MPPWFADPHYGKFSNSMRLTASEIEAITKWADAGAPEGNPRDLPKPAEWVEGWGIGKPDMVFELPLPFDVPARGVVDYQHIIVPTNFTEDRWIQAAEVRPTERTAVHHIIAFVREPKSKWFRSAGPASGDSSARAGEAHHGRLRHRVRKLSGHVQAQLRIRLEGGGNPSGRKRIFRVESLGSLGPPGCAQRVPEAAESGARRPS